MARKTLYTGIAVVGIALASGLAWWYQHSAPRGAAPQGPAAAAPAAGGAGPNAGGPVSVEVAKVQSVTLQDDAQSVGSLRSRQSVMLRPEVAGRIAQIGFVEGQRVRKG